MFTGIVEETGMVEAVKRSDSAIHLTVQAKICGRGLRFGDSLSVNGCCLTAVKIISRAGKKTVRFDLLEESWVRTNLQFARAGTTVNLERALRANGRLGGHFVTGHVDSMGEILRWEKIGADFFLEVSAAPELIRQIIFKGSIALDGISLTVAEVRRKSFVVWIIPHTHQATALRDRMVGDAVNLETDLIGKYVERFISTGPMCGTRSRRGAAR
ncbi:MAG: riboflavin synthase [Verrucomicrobiota bacterium]